MYCASATWVPALKLEPKAIVADQVPFACTCPLDSVKPVGSSSIMNNILAVSGEPSRSCSPLPLSLSIDPVIVNASPAIGLATIGSTTSIVKERIVTVEIFLWCGNKSKLPL